MNDERVVEEIVAKFFLNTCRLRPQLSRPAVEAALHNVRMAATQPHHDTEAYYIPLITGSVAEFYLEPMLPHIGDIDVMFYRNTQLAIPRGHPPPTQLPAEFHNNVKVYEITDEVNHITDSYSPGYVYCKLRYLLTECVDDGKYNAFEYNGQPRYLEYNNKSRPHGPALPDVYGGSLLSVDCVPCMRCLVWPPQATDWPTRHRNYGWPDSATTDRVISDGCDVVCVAHRRYRQDEVMSKIQWRLSFSRAEIVLLNSWMPVQQIVYHMLRVFMKTERLTGSTDNSEPRTLSNYQIKTLMLWACELKPSIWWTNDLSPVRICVELLHDLAVWLTDARCPNYFVSNCSLLDSSYNSEMIPSLLMSVNNSWLSSWFVYNYIRRCSHLCPLSVSQLFDDVSSITKLQNAVSAIIDWRQNTTLLDRWTAYSCACYYIAASANYYDMTAWRIDFAFTEARKISTSLPIYLSSATFLHVARSTTRSALNDELMDVLAALVGQSVGPRRYASRPSSVLLLNKAVNLMKTVDDNHMPESRSTMHLVIIELCKAYLYTALSCEDSDSDSIYCLANVYLAVLYYATGQYRTAIDHCTLVIKLSDHSQCSSHILPKILLKIDDNFDTVLGIAMLYQHIRITALNQQQQQQMHVAVFTTEAFAHYLHIRCMSVAKCHQLADTANTQSSTYEVYCHMKYIVNAQQLFIADVLLWKIVNVLYEHTIFDKQQTISRQFGIRQYPSKLNTTNLVELLQKCAVEHLTTFRQVEAQEFDSVATIVTTDFEALYAYKRGDYQQCLQLSTQNVSMLLYAVRMPHVPTYPEFLQLLDDDIVSLTALVLIVNPKCRYFDNDNSHVFITQLTLSLYLMTQCQLKLRHSVMLLAQTVGYIKVAQRRHTVEFTLDRLVLKMIAQKSLTDMYT